MSKKKVCITGGFGFIGTHLITSLRKTGYLVRVVDCLSPQIHGHLPTITGELTQDPGIEYTRADILTPKALNDAFQGVDYLIHLAAETGTAQSMYEIARYNAVNSQGTAELLDRLMNTEHSVKKVILASSRSIYGEGAYLCETCGIVTPDARTADALAKHLWEPPCPRCSAKLSLIATPESARPQPSSIYAATKLAQEDLVRIGCGAAGIPWVNLRFQNVYGPGQSLNNPYTGILSIFSTRIRRGLDLPIFEDGLESRDFVHVTDVAHAIGLCLGSPGADGKTLNVGAGVPTSVMEVAQMLNKVLGGRSHIEVTGQYRVGDIRHCFADISNLQKLTGYAPQVDLEKGLAAFAKWVLGQPLPEDGLDRANRLLIEKGLMK